MKRRDFVKNSAIAVAGVNILPSGTLSSDTKKIRMGFIGVGFRGQSHIENALRRNDVDIVAVCDVSDFMLQRTADIFKKAGKPMPQVFKGDPYAYRKLLELKNLDAVLIASPWEWHAPMIIDSLQAGLKYIATEVILGITMEDHWAVVREAEKQKANVMMLENVCYRRDVAAILNMVRQGMFGELLHLQAGYQHDLRTVKFNNGIDGGPGVEFGDKGISEAKWRTNHSVHRNGDLYPTHGIGPVAQMLDINHGNRFLSLSSFATKTRGLHKFIVDHAGENHPNAKVEFKLGDIVTTHIKCVNGETILLQHDTNNPRPYSLGFRVQGTKGIWIDVNKSLYIEGVTKTDDAWEDAQPYLTKYDHPLWARWSKDTEGAGHGGMDFFVLHAFVESVKRKVATPMDVYDAAVWSAITPLSEASIDLGNQTVDFPDFTSGQWMYRKNNFALTDEY